MIRVYCVSSDITRFTPRIINSVFMQYGRRLVILCASEEEVNTLDRALWTFSSDVFLPHGTMADEFAQEHPVLLGTGLDDRFSADTVVILDGVRFDNWTPAGRYVRITEQDPQAVSRSLPAGHEKKCFIENKQKWSEYYYD